MSDDSIKESAVAWHFITVRRSPLGEECTITEVEQEAEWIESTLTIVPYSHAISLRVKGRSKR